MEEFLEAIRNPFYLFYITLLMSLCIASSASQVGEAVEIEFKAHRMQQYEINGNLYGSKSTKIQYEAVHLDSGALRKCVVISWRDAATRDLTELLGVSIGGFLILIPEDLDSLSPEDHKLFVDMEQKLSLIKTDVAVYVTTSSEQALGVLQDVMGSGSKSTTATQQLVQSISGNTFQFTTTGNPSTNPITTPGTNIIGQLRSSEAGAPTIAFVAHYDSHAVFPGAGVGSDSNGSGIVALLELLAVFNKFYENASTRPPYNLIFAWTAAGKYNFQGSRSLIDGFISNLSANEKLQLAICLEAVGGPGPLHMHASKQPSDGAVAAQLLKRLRAVTPVQDVKLVTKKINLNAPHLSWEHERFNIKRMPAVTLSRLSNPDDFSRRSLLDNPSEISIDTLESNIRRIAEAVLGLIIATPEAGAADSRVKVDTSILAKDSIDKQRIAHFVRLFASRPRPFTDSEITKSVAANILSAAQAYSTANTQEVAIQDVQVWGGVTDRVLAEKVKPAIFELFVAGSIIVYLAVFYQIVSLSQRTIEGTVASLKKRV
ncbi:unnamed protein product [Auanema sp. JU1783]|nr:unnamed protein product [Auanema sp. JU1783]